MPLQIVHDFLQETENGTILTLYLSRHTDVEIAQELGRFEDPFDDRNVYSYIQRRYRQLPINQIRLVTGEHQVITLSYMSILAHKRSAGWH
ncbi:hypothetical protein [Tumebacillus permanentifrigoris]|uniref:Uncharacterized protein n=1 Tax=Tumebacillus permanentifrigoris TaxID=378543 RepID=A0A316D442_9BACL|nr:hypothetical protein [Tumebacillus permanentifrigoris]PWK05970.1 hypothetical protein C7459_12133 [Tumebacillus permanentifrigoris]